MLEFPVDTEVTPELVTYPAPLVNWLLLVGIVVLLKAFDPNISDDNFLFCAVPPSKTTNSSLLVSQPWVISVNSVRSTFTASAEISINDPAPTFKVTPPEVPPPVNPLPAVTPVISPWGTEKDVDKVPPSCWVSVRVTVEVPLSLKPVIILSYDVFHSVDVPPVAVTTPLTVTPAEVVCSLLLPLCNSFTALSGCIHSI